jgi:hypothetical protein
MSTIQNAHALIIGIDNYHHVEKLSSAVQKDATDIYDLLIDPAYCAYSSDNVKVLLNDKATKAGITEALNNLAQRCDSDSTVFFYISCHGGQIESGNYAGEYLAPVDVVNTSEQALAHSAISSTDFTEALRKIPARKMVIIFDCCHSGGIGQPKDTNSPILKTGLSEKYYDVLKEGRGRVILASSRSSEVSWILPGDVNSLFTKHLLAGFKGGAIGVGGVIRILDLFNYLQPKVTADKPEQHPILKAEIEENFPIALHKGGESPPLPPTTLPPDDYQYDVFISYRSKESDKQLQVSSDKPYADAKWVRKTLIPYLESQGLKVYVDFRFPLGHYFINCMEEAIQQSRYTVLIISPAYLESTYTEFQNIATQQLGLEQRQPRLIPLMREECQPRLGLRSLFFLDMTDEDEFEMNIERLVYELRQC